MYKEEPSHLVSIDATDSHTGEVYDFIATKSKKKYYSIKNLNRRIAIMDLFTMQSKICTSSKDIEIFRDLLYKVDKNNVLTINVTKFAKQCGVGRNKISVIIRKAKEVDLLRDKEIIGLYDVNPFVFQSRGSNTELIAEAQKKWSENPND